MILYVNHYNLPSSFSNIIIEQNDQITKACSRICITLDTGMGQPLKCNQQLSLGEN